MDIHKLIKAKKDIYGQLTKKNITFYTLYNDIQELKKIFLENFQLHLALCNDSSAYVPTISNSHKNVNLKVNY